jgi:hypothetical protein
VCVCVCARATEMEEHNFEQRCAIKFCVKFGETGIETFNKLKQAYGTWPTNTTDIKFQRTKVRDPVSWNDVLSDENLVPPATPSWRGIPCLLFGAVYTTCSQLTSVTASCVLRPPEDKPRRDNKKIPLKRNYVYKMVLYDKYMAQKSKRNWK